MELFTGEWFWALAVIIAIDLVLAGDNAIVIAMAARSLPERMQKKAVFYGTLGAILARIVFASFAILLLRLPFVSATGGLLLYWVAHKLVINKEVGKHKHHEASTFLQAMLLIVFADTLMALDNVIAIAGAAKGDIMLVVIGLVVSIPIVMWGSFFILRFIDRHQWIVWAGGALLVHIGGDMIASDAWMKEAFFDDNELFGHALRLLPPVLMFFYGWWMSRRQLARA